LLVNFGRKRVSSNRLQAASLKILHESDLKPYVVFLAPPSLQTYKQQKAKYGELYRVSLAYLKTCLHRWRDAVWHEIPFLPDDI
jgi:hypothetical protein